jgi:predicted nucleic acid-binding protein
MIFLDTSAFAKLYVPEAESAVLRKLVEAEDEVCASELVRVELMSVFHRRWREAKWSQADFLAAVRQFSADDLGGFWSWIPLNRAIVEAAAQTYTTLPADAFLRSSDCLHLVTAIQQNFVEVHTYDAHQTAAAAALGLKPIALRASR